MRRAIHATSWVLASLASVGVILIMLATVADVARRSATGRALPGTVDYSEMLMVALVFLALGLTQRDRGHVSVNLATARLPPGLARWARVIGLVVATALMTWLMVAAGQEALRSFDRNEFRFGLLRIPVWPARAAIPLGTLALVLELAVSTVDAGRTRGAAAAAPIIDGGRPS